MTQLDLLRRFNRAHEIIVFDIERYVKEHGGYIRCHKSKYMKYLDPTDDRSGTVYKFDHIYMDNGECIVSYTDNTELGDIELKNLTFDELHDLLEDIIDRSTMDNDWSRYIDYLHEWADYHAGSINSGMSPVSFDEWMDNKREACE